MSEYESSKESIAEAFILYVENKLEGYSWGPTELACLCEDEPIEGYHCILSIIESALPTTAAATGDHLKKILEGSAELILPRLEKGLEQPAESSEPLKSALASAMCFGIYTGNTDFDARLEQLFSKYKLSDLYEKHYSISAELQNNTHVFQYQENKLSFSYRKAADFNAFDFALLFEVANNSNKIRVCGKVASEEIEKWQNELEKLYKDLQGDCRIKLGDKSCVNFLLSINQRGELKVRVNFRIKELLMPHLLKLELDQTHLRLLIERLKLAANRYHQ